MYFVTFYVLLAIYGYILYTPKLVIYAYFSRFYPQKGVFTPKRGIFDPFWGLKGPLLSKIMFEALRASLICSIITILPLCTYIYSSLLSYVSLCQFLPRRRDFWAFFGPPDPPKLRFRPREEGIRGFFGGPNFGRFFGLRAVLVGPGPRFWRYACLQGGTILDPPTSPNELLRVPADFDQKCQKWPFLGIFGPPPIPAKYHP